MTKTAELIIKLLVMSELQITLSAQNLVAEMDWKEIRQLALEAAKENRIDVSELEE